MLKTSYTSESEIPDNLKGAYTQKDGKWVLDELSDDHPVIVSKKSALADKSRAVQRSEELQADLETAKSSGVPRGHVAVPKADADLIPKLKEFGTPAEIESKLNEFQTLKAEVETRKRTDHLREVAKALNYESEVFVRLQNLPEFEIRDADGKKTVIAKVKGENNAITEKLAQEFIESSSDIAPFLPALKATGNGTRVHTTTTTTKPPKDVFEKVRDDQNRRNKQTQTELNPMFQKIPGRVVASAGE